MERTDESIYIIKLKMKSAKIFSENQLPLIMKALDLLKQLKKNDIEKGSKTVKKRVRRNKKIGFKNEKRQFFLTS